MSLKRKAKSETDIIERFLNILWKKQVENLKTATK